VPVEAVESADAPKEPEAAEKAAEAVAPDSPETNEQQPQMIEESEAPAIQAAEPAAEEEAPTSRKIVKCRDNSGGVTFTQGYCPPGTRQVDVTSSE
jgi:hypothetical protein